MKRLPITKKQRAAIISRARWREQNVMIRALRTVLFDRGFLPPHVTKIVSEVIRERSRVPVDRGREEGAGRTP
jgi:hypothetical protein